jgi:predicted alpha-1,6-mannanase (GH76 family)
VQVARAAAAYFSVGSDGVLREVSCGRPAGRCDGKDGQQFKGAFVRHLGYLAAALPPAAAGDAAWARAYLATQSASIAASNARDGPSGQTQFGLLWQGPFDEDAAEPWVAHGAALDALLAGALLDAQSEA